MAGTAVPAEVVTRFLERWHQVVESRDTGAIGLLLSEDVELGAPTAVSCGSTC